MKWPWHHDKPADRPNPERARRQRELVARQRPEVERLAGEIREYARRNNFAANVFALDPARRRDR